MKTVKNPRLKTTGINPKNGSKRDAFDDLMQIDHESGERNQTAKLARKEKVFGRLGTISELEVKLARIRAGQSFLAIAQN